jgi:cytosine/adenosine deaminase-related metal-dependent hydrolase
VYIDKYWTLVQRPFLYYLSRLLPIFDNNTPCSASESRTPFLDLFELLSRIEVKYFVFVIMSSSGALLYTHATIITVNSAREIFLDASLLVHKSRIVSISKSHNNFASLLPPDTDIKTIDCSGRIIIPGLINTHAHLAQSLLRGLAEDLPLHSWLCDAVWPLEASYQKDDGYVAAMLTIAEMLTSGTTCFLEAMLTHGSGIENVVRAVGETGVRACLVS